MESIKIRNIIYLAVLFLSPLTVIYAYIDYSPPRADIITKLYVNGMISMIFNFVCCALLCIKYGRKVIYLPIFYGLTLILLVMSLGEGAIIFGMVLGLFIPISLIYAWGFIIYDKFLKLKKE